jgi:hypothetical protein
MSCLSCGSKNQTEFSAEMLIHFDGLGNLDKPGVWLFPKLFVCFDCGCLQTTVAASELTSLAVGTSKSDQVSEWALDEKLAN